MKVFTEKEIRDIALKCGNCQKIIGKKCWRAFLDGTIMEDGNE